MTNLKIRNILISDLKLFLIKGAPFEENETCFLYKGVSYTREPTVFRLPYLGVNFGTPAPFLGMKLFFSLFKSHPLWVPP